MKVLSLNTWCGKEFTRLVEFLTEKRDEVDVLCLQEIFDSNEFLKINPNIRSNLWTEICKIFPTYQQFFCPVMKDTDNQGTSIKGLLFGLGVLTKKTIEVETEGDIFVYSSRFASIHGDPKTIPVNVQYVKLKMGTKSVLICHIKGKWFPGDKLDTPERIKQSEGILNFLKKHQEPKIICGDFNLLPETQSIKMLERSMKNLIKEFNIATTRSKLNTYCGKPGDQKFADYVFVSPEVRILNFAVPKVAVSDHLPMILEFKV